MSSRSQRCRLASCALAAALSAGVTACDGYSISGNTGRYAGVDGRSAAGAALVGTWQRAFYFLDGFGYANGTETTWTFNADGSALRSVVTSNFTLGVADTLLTKARYEVSGTQVIIDFVAPATGRIVLDFRFAGSQLVLAGEAYRRLAG